MYVQPIVNQLTTFNLLILVDLVKADIVESKPFKASSFFHVVIENSDKSPQRVRCSAGVDIAKSKIKFMFMH